MKEALTQAAQQAHELTQPATIALGTSLLFGLTLDDVIKIGTVCLLALNIPLAALRIWEILEEKLNKKDKEDNDGTNA